MGTPGGTTDIPAPPVCDHDFSVVTLAGYKCSKCGEQKAYYHDWEVLYDAWKTRPRAISTPAVILRGKWRPLGLDASPAAERSNAPGITGRAGTEWEHWGYTWVLQVLWYRYHKRRNNKVKPSLSFDGFKFYKGVWDSPRIPHLSVGLQRGMRGGYST